MIALDTNVLFYALDPVAGEKHERAREIVALAQPLRTIIPLQALGELCVSIGKKKPALLVDAYAAARQMMLSFGIVAQTVTDFHEAAHAQQLHKLPFWDAMIWATVRRAGCTVLLSEDFQDGRTLSAVTFRNPFAMSNSELVDLLN